MKVLLLILLSIILAGCQTTGSLKPLTYKGQKQIVRDGSLSIYSKNRNTLTLTPVSNSIESGGRASLVLAVSNGTKQDVLFSTEDISAVALIPNVEKLEEESANNKEDEGSKKEPSVTDAEQALKKHKALPHDAVDLKIFTYEELVDEEERRAALQAFAVALGGVGRSMQASNAGYQSGYGTYNAYSPSGGSAFGSYNYSSYNYAAAQAAQSAAQAETDLEMSNAMANSEANLRHLRNTILKKHTLLPGETHGGIVQIQMPELSNNLAEVPVLLTVKVGKEEHQFYYQFTKNQ